MGQMAMQHPVARIIGYELDISRLRNTNQHGITWKPSSFRNPAALGSGNVERMSMQMNRMMVHAEIDQPDTNAIT